MRIDDSQELPIAEIEPPIRDADRAGATLSPQAHEPDNKALMSARAVLRLLRPKQWTKGLLVFAALLFTRGFLVPSQCLLALEAFVAIGLVSSGVYVANDLLDVERDRRHPAKKLRPIASGQVSPPAAVALTIICVALGLALGILLGPWALAVLAAYLAIQGAYNLGLKHQPVADVFCISLGFVLRAVMGAVAIHVAVSGWLLFCTGALALMLGFGKRRHEFILQGEDRTLSRESLAHYTGPALDGLILIASASAALSYGIYSVDSPTARDHPALILSSFWVFYGIYRYTFLLLANDEGGEPENLIFRDPHMAATLALYLVTVVVAMSGLGLPFIEGRPG